MDFNLSLITHPRISRLALVLGVILFLCLLTSTAHASPHLPELLAQADGAQQNQGSSVIEQSRNYIFESLLVLVLFAGALFVVCRSGRRV